jgi:acetyl/propionyl-CoA carboxylase alpha subunit
MVRALQDTVVLGITTNIPYLLDILRHPDFESGRLSTSFLQESLEPWHPSADTSNSTWLALAAFEHETEERGGIGAVEGILADSQRQKDPWLHAGKWRNVG